GVQLHAIALTIVLLVHVTPDYRTYLRVTVDHLKETVGAGHHPSIQPLAAHRHRMVVQAHHDVLATGFVQRLVEEGDIVVVQLAGHITGDGGVKHDKGPGAHVDDTRAHLVALVTQHIEHRRRLVVITFKPVAGS